ncbi:GL21364 [Drosophila persimilis]|uniref:GL21364 n=1 Tax=Drosophila persimilis TaxID=7234 RepID=B4HBA4_DROPE|nr:GL21364 [Drosophila persimilis]
MDEGMEGTKDNEARKQLKLRQGKRDRDLEILRRHKSSNCTAARETNPEGFEIGIDDGDGGDSRDMFESGLCEGPWTLDPGPWTQRERGKLHEKSGLPREALVPLNIFAKCYGNRNGGQKRPLDMAWGYSYCLCPTVLVISLEGWTDIMYYVQDAHSFWDWIYFVLLIVIGSFFMINLCLVVIATQFSETKKREMERMRQERARYTFHVDAGQQHKQLGTGHMYQRQQRKEGLLPNADNLTFSPSRIKCHHPKCPKYSNRKHPSSIQDQMITVMVPLNSNSNSNNNNNNTNNHNGSTNTNATNNVPSCTTVALVNGINGSTASVTMSTAQHQQAAQQQQQQQQQHSSSDNTEQSMGEAACGGGSMVMPRSSSLRKSSHHQLKPEGSAGEQKTILLKFPQQIMDSEQLIVSI